MARCGLSLEDFVASDGRAVDLEDVAQLGFPRNWPGVYSQSAALKSLIGKRGPLAGRKVAVVGAPLPAERAALPAVELFPLCSFDNAERMAKALPGLSVVRGWVVWECLDRPEGTRFVAESYWWNSFDDGRWVDMTPRPEGIPELLLVDPVVASRKSAQGPKEALLALLLQQRFPTAAKSILPLLLPPPVPVKAAPVKQAPPERAAAPLDYSKWSSIVDSEDEEEVLSAPAHAAHAEECGVKDLAEGKTAKKPLPVPDYLLGNTAGGGATNCYLSVCKLLDSDMQKETNDNTHQLAITFSRIFHGSMKDSHRQRFYREALARLPAGAFVIVVGLGSIVPMLLAARRGPTSGAVLEMSVRLGKVAEGLLHSNSLAFPVAVVKEGLDNQEAVAALIRSIVPRSTKSVVIVTERMAPDLLSSGIVPSTVAVHKAVRAHLGGASIKHIPQQVELFATPVEIRSETLRDLDIRPFNAFRHTSSNEKSDFWWWPVRLDNQAHTKVALLGPAKTLCGFDFERSSEIGLGEVRLSLDFEMKVRGRCNGVAMWWAARCDDLEFSTKPLLREEASKRVSEGKQAVHYLAGETAVFPGDTLSVLVSITPCFTVRMQQTSPFSVEVPRWVQAPTGAKVSATLPVLPYHFVMLTDLERLEVYGRAIRAAVEQQRKRLGRRPRVLDAGCGLGLLGIMAALEGAEVWLCEAMAPLRQMCRDVLAANTSGITESRGLCQLLPPMMSTRLRIGEDVEHQFDIVVSEVLDLWCLGEGVIPTMRHAHKKLLAPGGELLPHRLAIFAQPVELDLWEQAEQELLKKSDNMAWWKGTDVEVGSEKVHVDTLYDVLDKMCRVPERPTSAPMRMPVSGIYKIKGVGDVLAGRVEQGVVKPGEEVIFLPTHTTANPCSGKVFTVEMHHQRVDVANPGDNVGLNIKGLVKENMPRSGDVMVYKKDTTLGQTKEFAAQIQVLDIPNEIKVGYSPIGFVRCGRSACRVSALKWKMGKETGGKKMEDPHSLKSNEMAECCFQPQQPLVCDTFKNCEGLSRVAFMDGNGVVMLGKVISCERKEEGGAGGKKK